MVMSDFQPSRFWGIPVEFHKMWDVVPKLCLFACLAPLCTRSWPCVDFRAWRWDFRMRLRALPKNPLFRPRARPVATGPRFPPVKLPPLAVVFLDRGLATLPWLPGWVPLNSPLNSYCGYIVHTPQISVPHGSSSFISPPASNPEVHTGSPCQSTLILLLRFSVRPFFLNEMLLVLCWTADGWFLNCCWTFLMSFTSIVQKT